MVESYRRSKGKQRLLGSHQKCWIWGRHAVLETLHAGRWPILELRLSDRLAPDEIETAAALAERSRTPVLVESADALARLCRSSEHQGYVAKMPPFPFADADALINGRSGTCFFAMLDGIQDPYNFGAILRSADALGVQGVFIGAKEQAGVTSLVARTSAGAVNYVPIAQVHDLSALATELKQDHVRLIAASEKAERDIFHCDLRGPIVIVIGNEGRGIGPELLSRCDEQVRIPLSGHVGSLNAAVSAGILFYEATRQRAMDT